MELYKKYRPLTLKEIVGQPEAVRILEQFRKKNTMPHSVLFTGPSGCGKTTLSRIIRTYVDCKLEDYVELNCADFRGIDMVRDLRSKLSLAPMGGGSSRVYYVDECHQLTKDAQNGMLKMLEDTPRHIYFFLATSEPNKLITAIKTRCTEIKVKYLSISDLKLLVLSTTDTEKVTISEDVVDKIAELAEGSARKALVLLQAVIDISGEDEQLEALEKSVPYAQGIELARLLLNPRSTWPEAAKLIKSMEDEPESVRRLVLGYMTTVMLSNMKLASRCFLIVQIFRDHWYDCGKAGLAACCYEVLTSGKSR